MLGTLKIGSHIKDDRNEVPNDYFAMGNLTSILLCLVYWPAKRLLIGA